MLAPFFVRTQVKREKVLKKVDPMQVARLTTVKNYTTIYLIDGTAYPVRTSLVNALSSFPRGMFIRINRADVVSVFHVDHITKDHLILHGKTVSIARSYYKYVVAGVSIVEEEQ
jgi:DNA-binding LytR/AlgR family response regulator